MIGSELFCWSYGETTDPTEITEIVLLTQQFYGIYKFVSCSYFCGVDYSYLCIRVLIRHLTGFVPNLYYITLDVGVKKVNERAFS